MKTEEDPGRPMKTQGTAGAAAAGTAALQERPETAVKVRWFAGRGLD